jgi:signal transduction histidine kinase
VDQHARDAGAIELVIRDDGIGIPDEHLAHIFEPFYTTKEAGGSGLGLAISQNIVERHGGHIELKSVVGEGTTFKIVLPIDSQRPAVRRARRCRSRRLR